MARLFHFGGSHLSPRDRWLNYLERQLEEVDGLEHMKLALYPDLKFCQHQISVGSIKTPTDVFRAVVEQCGDEQIALAKYHCALKSLGKKLRGAMCIESAKEQFDFHLPPPLGPEHRSKEFQFFLCLTKISKTLRNQRPVEQNGERNVVRWFCSQKYLKTNPANIRHLPDLFVRAYQERIITPDNTQALRDCLLHYQLYKALKYLYIYCGSVFTSNPNESVAHICKCCMYTLLVIVLQAFLTYRLYIRACLYYAIMFS